MKTVKKVSAFSVFKKKEETKTGDLKKGKGSTEINRSASCPSVTKTELKSNKLMKVLKGGSLRSSSKNGGRPSVFDSPFVAGSTNHSVRLTSLQRRQSSSSRFVAHGLSAVDDDENVLCDLVSRLLRRDNSGRFLQDIVTRWGWNGTKFTEKVEKNELAEHLSQILQNVTRKETVTDNGD